MKKLILSLSVLALLTSCGSKTEQEENVENQNEETVEEVVPEELSFTSLDFLQRYHEGQEEFLNTLKGNNVTLTQVLFQSGNESFMYGWGYDGSQASIYTDPEGGFKNMVGNNELLAYKESNLSYEFLNFQRENLEEFVPIEMIAQEDGTDEIFHTVFTCLVSGDSIKSKSSIILEISGAKIISSENY